MANSTGLTPSQPFARSMWLSEIARYRNLIYFFTWRYLKVRYKQTAIGIFWVMLQPLLLAGIVSIFIFRGLNIDFGYGGSVPVLILAFMGFSAWVFFDRTTNTISNSLISNRGIILKVFFPRVIPSLGGLLAGVVDMLSSIGLLFVLLFITTTGFHAIGLLYMLVALLILIVFTYGFGLLLAASTVEYRDVSQIMPLIFRVGIFVSPVFYPVSFLPDSFQTYAFINPLAGAIELFRSGFFDPSLIYWPGVLLSASTALVILAFALWRFRKKEHYLVDVI